ncbi:peptidase inhibitor family I36 protein [Streptomyces ardesiacus]|uniref:peptidase inhibitor family I36 protein n=1 Tax=Streptomyces ardesiacus TaxID=285564 RepID=UPI000A6F880C|nr:MULTISPECIES: peptidase inhibitor family I36 protein [Streptomyces]MCL7368600.1 peptidase inhibitor family I36 protein [Streptomyces ardesiacus]
MKKLLGVASTTAAVVAAGMFAAPPASASNQSDCIALKLVCVWSNTNFSGNTFTANSNWGGSCKNSLVVGNSVAQGRGAIIRFYSKDNCTGSYFDIKVNNYSSKTPFAVHSFQVKPI